MRVVTAGSVIVLFFGGIVFAQYETPAPTPPPLAPASPTPMASPAPVSPTPLAQATANVRVEVRTAATHAGFASKGGNLGYVRLHLGHALNCLEGPRGANFNKSWGNVCAGQGNGILTDLKTAPMASTLMALARKADQIAAKGVKTAKLTDAKTSAQQVASLLNQIAAKLK